MLPLLSLFLICTVVRPSVGEQLRRRHRDGERRKHLDRLLRDGSIAAYSFS